MKGKTISEGMSKWRRTNKGAGMSMSVTMQWNKEKTIDMIEEQFAGSEWASNVVIENGVSKMVFLGDNGKRSKLVLTFHDEFFNVHQGITARALITYKDLFTVMVVGRMKQDIAFILENGSNVSFSL